MTHVSAQPNWWGESRNTYWKKNLKIPTSMYRRKIPWWGESRNYLLEKKISRYPYQDTYISVQKKESMRTGQSHVPQYSTLSCSLFISVDCMCKKHTYMHTTFHSTQGGKKMAQMINQTLDWHKSAVSWDLKGFFFWTTPYSRNAERLPNSGTLNSMQANIIHREFLWPDFLLVLHPQKQW